MDNLESDYDSEMELLRNLLIGYKEKYTGGMSTLNADALRAKMKARRVIEPYIAKSVDRHPAYAIDSVSHIIASLTSMHMTGTICPGTKGFRRMFRKIMYKGYPIWRTDQDRDHIFFPEDFIAFSDRVVNEKVGYFSNEVTSAYEDGVCYNYTPVEDGLLFSWQIGIGGEHASLPVSVEVVGCRIRREGDAIHLMALLALDGDCAQVIDYVAERSALPFSANNTMVAYCLTLTAKGVVGEPAFMLIREEAHEIMAGHWPQDGDGWLFGNDDTKDISTLMERILGSATPVMAKLLSLGSYFRFRRDRIVLETSAGRSSGGGTSQPSGGASRNTAEKRERKFKVVAALRIVSMAPRSDGGSGRGYTPPDHAVEVEGHWRKLSATSVGVGPNGEPVVGKTFVRGHRRWKDKPERPRTILLKQPVAPYLEGKAA